MISSSGTLSLTAINTYAGSTTVSGGTLALSGAGGGSGVARSTLTINSAPLSQWVGISGRPGTLPTEALSPISPSSPSMAARSLSLVLQPKMMARRPRP